MNTVRLVGFRKGSRIVSLIRAMRDYSTGTLAEAERLVEKVKDGEKVALEFSTPEDRDAFRALAGEYDVLVE
jgi:crotonobetainyl-CoA:carnitine CoA-transferase CaiB-like acyl-CoA transferase